MSLFTFFLVLLFLQSYSHSKEIRPNSEFVTPEVLYSEAKRNNLVLKSLKHKINANKLSTESSKLLMDPRFKFEIQRLPVSRPYDFMNIDMYMFGLEQEIIIPQKIKARSMVENYELEKTNLLYNKVELDIELKIYNLFYRFHYFYNKDKILRNELDILNQLKDIVKNKYILSQTMQTELLKVDSEILMIKNEIAKNQNEIQTIKSEINYLLSRDPQSEINPPSDYEVVKPEVDEKSIKIFTKLRPEVKIAEIELKKREGIKRLSQLSKEFPDLMVAGGYQLNPMMRDGLYFMVSISIPWINKKNEYEYLMSKEMYSEEMEMYKDQLNMAESEIYMQLKKLNRLYEIITNIEKIVQIKEQTFQIELSMYEKNQMIFDNVLETLRELFIIKLEYINMKSEYIMTYTDLLRCCGLSVRSSFVKKEENNE